MQWKAAVVGGRLRLTTVSSEVETSWWPIGLLGAWWPEDEDKVEATCRRTNNADVLGGFLPTLFVSD